SFITQVTFLKYANAEELSNILRPLISQNGLIVAEPSANALVLADTADNIRRFVKIVTVLDVAGAQRQIQVFFLKYASAETLARELGTIMQQQLRSAAAGLPPGSVVPPGANPGGDPSSTFAIVPDPRTNSLIVLGTAEQIGLASSLIVKLDIPATTET